MNVGSYAFAQLLRVLPRTRITRAVGQLCELPLPPLVSRAVVGAYARAYRVDMHEAADLNGDGAYPSFDAFFTRELRHGVRPLAQGGGLVSPCDGRLDEAGEVSRQGRIRVKGRDYRAADLLGSEAEVERYLGGHFNVIYLSPRDYHRVHAPCDGTLAEVRSYPGDLYPVNSISERHIPQFLARNRRVAIALDTEALGRVTMVMVAAMIVGRITVSGIAERDVPLGLHVPEIERRCGDEVGIFHLGSTVVMFCESAVPSLTRALGPVLLGEPLTGPPLAETPEAESATESSASGPSEESAS